ncbi:MAG: glucans biosynthesis glucosyltransferase MdoH [Herminiimonas sp.]|nr:glucans biosynthesis glucosyltransferase MdoH [Herminiimonas sp.]
MELHITAGVTRPIAGQSRRARYLACLQGSRDAAVAEGTDVASRIAGQGGDDASVGDAHLRLAGVDADQANPAQGSIAARLRMAFVDGASAVEAAVSTAKPARRVAFAPPLCRGPMVPTAWGALNPLRRWFQAVLRRRRDWVERRPDDARHPWPAAQPATTTTTATAPRADTATLASATASDASVAASRPDPTRPWQHLGNLRRLTLLVLMLAQTGVATYFMRAVLPYQGTAKLEILLLAMFAVLFCWISAGFWTAMAGFLVLLRGADKFAISRNLDASAALPPAARTAIVMPICNEDVVRVFAGLRATYESIARTGELAQFDFFILSDTSESDVRSAELAAWAALCREVGGFGRIFYRHRRRRVKRKSGNLDDFCRRWGRNYRYMLVLDADSVMSGACVTNLVRLMENNPGSGIIQTAPVAAGRDTLYSRIQQFSTRVYGPLFTAGLHYWQLGESHYWGHNAIIRIAPFMQHCALSALPGRGSLAGDILSHDFVEAALMRRAGWAVWIAYDLDGSYEEMPSSLLEELKRDRRWCHGNLMNFRLFTARGMHPVHRAVFATGVMAYLSAPLWFLFLALSTVLLALQTLTDPQYFLQPRQLFPIWPEWHPEQALALFSATATLLFLPKLLGVLLACAKSAAQFGGVLRLLASMLLEMLFSMLLAPVRMMFHTRFVVAAFLGLALHWKSPPRSDAQTHWAEALGKHGADMLLGAAWAGGVWLLNPAFLPWLLPIAGGLMLSAPISILSSQVALGRWCRAANLFVIPEELLSPIELQATAMHHQAMPRLPGFAEAVVDPVLNALACAAGRQTRSAGPAGAPARYAAGGAESHAAWAFATAGPSALGEKQRNTLLDNAARLSHLHLAVWSSAEALAQWENPAHT